MNYVKKIFVGVLLFFLGITSVYALDVGIKSISVKEKSDDIEVSTPTISGKNIDSTIKFHELNDYVTFEVELDNEKENAITGVTDNNENEFIESSYTFEDTKFTITLKYKKELSGELELDDIKITVTFEDGSSEEINPTPTPKTNDNIIKYVILLAVSICGLFIGFKFYKKQIKMALMLMIIILPVMALATESITSVYTLKADNISIVRKFTISYEKNEGTGNTPDKVINEGESIGELPEVARENYVLDGWYSDNGFDHVVDSTYVPEGDVTLYAKWLKSVGGATVDPEEFTIAIGGSETITVTDVEEEYTFTSSDPSIATVDENGKVTGVAEGTVTITIKGKKSEETKTVSVDVEKAIKIINRQDERTISRGDEISIVNEDFYVVSSNAEETVLLSKYNLYVGDIMNYDSGNNKVTYDSSISTEDEKYGLQDELAVGTKIGLNKYYATVAFSGNNYWDNKSCEYNGTTYSCTGDMGLKDGFTGSYAGNPYPEIYRGNLDTTLPTYDYDLGFGYAQNNGYTIAYYVNEYVDMLKEKGAPETIDGRLLINEEAEDLGCDVEYMNCYAAPNWVKTSSYWVGSASGYAMPRFINADGVFDQVNFAHNYGLGVRPVIVVNTSDLIEEDEVTITYDANEGTVTPNYVILEKGTAISTLPTPVRDNYVLDGWCTESTLDNKIDETYVVEENGTLYAKWLKSIKGSTVSPTEINIEVEGTETITVTNVEEEYMCSSDDTNVATVNENCVVTGTGAGSTTITIAGLSSTETKTVTVTVTAPVVNPISYVNRQNAGVISVGDEIAIGTEHFYVVSTNSTNTSLLAKYNLYVGDIMSSDFSSHTTISSTDDGYGLQNPLALGQKQGLSQYVGTVAFSGSKYWSNSDYANVYRSDLSTTAPEYTYEPTYGTYTGGNAQDNGYTIAYYVEEYVGRLKEIGAPDTITGRLLLDSEASSLGCYGEYMCTNSTYSWMYSTSYWLSSFSQDVGSDSIGFISTNNQYDYNYYKMNNQFGVRPVIVINTTDLDV